MTTTEKEIPPAKGAEKSDANRGQKLPEFRDGKQPVTGDEKPLREGIDGGNKDPYVDLDLDLDLDLDDADDGDPTGNDTPRK